MVHKQLMGLLLEAGYPKEEMFNHCSDLYVYQRPDYRQTHVRHCIPIRAVLEQKRR